MGSESVHSSQDPTNPVLVALASRRRRVILATLADASGRVPVPELATHVAAALRDTSFVDVAADERKREHVALVHRELPKLDETGLVEWDREDGAAETADHSALADPNLRDVIESPRQEWDDILETLAHGRRHVALSVLVDHGGAIARRNLARRTLARERDESAESVSSDAVDETLASLHHVHLPKLREAGLVVDDDLETVRYADHPDLDEESLTVDASQGPATMALVTQ
jgi:DNA-binding transcriptional ArsR family regulator